MAGLSAGGRPVKKFLMGLSSEERAAEVKADSSDKFFRVLFAAEGRFNQVLLSLEAFAKKTPQFPLLVAASERRRRLLRELVERRKTRACPRPQSPPA